MKQNLNQYTSIILVSKKTIWVGKCGIILDFTTVQAKVTMHRADGYELKLI